ncbi:Gfo/Idh/MocA family protein [Aestuariimicrobium ganziense]|uniref:Gfo/Idh/MocA family protein n=1 Tax=Aestuariimicrobium ganziense TaxID=2773677 RepID=UPI0019433D84|nr:Gfo/Idh/MocA family oxidoreductase [Aestuariimicrobium ganziense]
MSTPSTPADLVPVRIATVGTSLIVERFVAAAREVDDIEVVCAYSRDTDRARSFAREQAIPRSTSDWQGLLADPEIDAVYIASPNLVHVEQSEQVIAAGKHVLVEKPATPTSDEWQRLVEQAAGQGVVVLEEMRPAHDPGTAEVARLLPQLGPVRRVSFDYTQRSSRYDQVLAGEKVAIFDPALAGGSFNDLGVYAVSQLVQLFGEPDQVVAAAEYELTTGAEGLGVALALYPGFVADLSHSKITRTDRPSEVQGELGSLTVDRISDPLRITLTLLDDSSTTVEVTKCDDTMTYAIAHFVDCVRGRADASVDQQRTLATLRTMERIRDVRQRVGPTS